MFTIDQGLAPRYAGFGVLHARAAATANGVSARTLQDLRSSIDEAALARAEANAREWEEVFRRMGASSRRLPSLSALLAGARSGSLRSISPLVDFYNHLSLLAGAPMAAYDADRVNGDIILRDARPGERFTPMGNPNQQEKCKPGEVVYADTEKVLCRYWNHQDSYLTRVTDTTMNVIFFTDLLPGPTAEISARIVEDWLGRVFGAANTLLQVPPSSETTP